MSVGNFGRIVRERRERMGMTIAQAAELCCLSERGLWLIEVGDVDPKLSSLLRIAAVFKIDLGDVDVCKGLGPSVLDRSDSS